MPTLPPPGSDPSEIASFVDRVVTECASDQRRLEWEAELEVGYQMHVGDHFSKVTPDVVQVVINRVQNCAISLMAIQAGDPPKITFKPRESGEPPLHYLNTDQPMGQRLAAELLAEAQAAGQPWQPTDPLPEPAVAEVKNLIAQGELLNAQLAMAGMPPSPDVIPKDVLVEVSDRTAVEALQTIVDALWESEDCQYAFAENILLKNVCGRQPTLFEWCDERHKPILTNVLPVHVFSDPLTSDPGKSDYDIYFEPISADRAKATYPHLAAEIEAEFAGGGILKRPGSGQFQPSSRVQGNFHRDMGYIIHAWFRHQPYPMTEEEALNTGRIVATDEPTGEWEQGPDEQAPDGTVLPGQPSPVTRRVIRDAKSYDEVGPTELDEEGRTRPHPKWPVRYGIRQLKIIAGVCVEDRECQFPDSQIKTNLNVLVPWSPYAQGEAYRLAPLQVALNYVISSIVTHQRYNALPPELIHQEVAEGMGASLADARTKPGQRIQIPASVAALLGNDLSKAIQSIPVEALPTDVWKLLEFLVSMIDQEGNQSDVMQGNASASWSGEAIASLQNAAGQVIKAKSIMTEFWLKRIGRDMAHAVATRMPPDVKRRYLSGKPYHAILALDGLHKNIQYDVSVEITSGSGAARSSQTNNLIAARANGVPISTPAILQRLDVDPDTDLQEEMEYQRKRAAFMPQQAAAGPAANNGGDAGQQAAGGRQPAPAQ